MKLGIAFAQLRFLKMGTGETGTPTKAAKLSIAQDQQASYPEWAAAFQAYYSSGGQPPHGYFPPSIAAGPQPAPYMWGPQAIMPPYGTHPHPPYGAVYPHRGVYGHPTITPRSHAYGQSGLLSTGAASEGTMATLTGGEADGCKLTDNSKDRSPIRRSKGSLGNVGLKESKVSDTGQGHSGSANGVFSQSSGESGSEGSSDGSEEDNAQNILQKRSFDQMTIDGAGSNCTLPAYCPQGGETFASPRGNVAGVQPGTTGQIGAASKMGSSSSLSTNLGISGQDYWSGSTHGSQGGKRTSASTSAVIVPTTPSTSLRGPLNQEGVSPELWLQDEREVKRQRRKQSNRESARRSRLRKQAECEELGTRVDALTVENMALRTELTRLSEECKKLTAENTSLLGQLQNSQEDEVKVLDQRVGMKTAAQAVSAQRHGRMSDVSSGSPQIHGSRAHDEDSCDSTGKRSSPLESGTCSEAVAAG